MSMLKLIIPTTVLVSAVLIKVAQSVRKGGVLVKTIEKNNNIRRDI